MVMTVMIVGGGKVGSSLASYLLEQGYRIKVVEVRRELMTRLKQSLPAESLVLGNGADPNVLETGGIRQAQVLAAVTGADETNLVICSLARFEFNVPRIIARVNNPKNAWLFTKEMGVDVALNQADLMAHLIAEEMSLGDMMTLLKLRRGQYSLVEEKVDPKSRVVGKPLSTVVLPDRCIVAAILRGGELLIPRPDTVLHESDEILAVVHSDQVSALAVALAPSD